MRQVEGYFTMLVDMNIVMNLLWNFDSLIENLILLQMEYKCSKHWIWVCFTDIFIGKLNSYMCTVRVRACGHAVRPAHSMRGLGEAWACACARPWIHERSVISIVGQHRSLATFVTKASIIGGYENRWILVCGPVCFGIDRWTSVLWNGFFPSGPCSVLWNGSFLLWTSMHACFGIDPFSMNQCALKWTLS